jgi:hypothetical protein
VGDQGQDFDRASAVVGRGDGTSYDADLHPAWTNAGHPNGGYLLATMARAAATSVLHDGHDHPHPLAASATYLRPPSVGPATVVVEVLRTGRTASQARVTLLEGDRTCVEALITLGRLSDDKPVFDDLAPVALPPEEDCLRFGAPPADPGVSAGPGAADPVTELRLDPAVLGFTTGVPGGTAEQRGWLRFTEDTPLGPLHLLYALDALPPATYDLGSVGWVPTVELTAYLRGLPAPGPLRVRQRARLVQGGRVDEACEVWDSTGRLVGQAVQLALVRLDARP